jgi:hypothetical protein
MFCARPLAGPPVTTQGSSVVAVLQASTAKVFRHPTVGKLQKDDLGYSQASNRKSQPTDFAR